MANSFGKFCLVLVFSFAQATRDKNFYMQSTSQTLKVISELPSKGDAYDYVGSLKLLIQYLLENKRCMDFSMKFALFLLNVNLRSFIGEENLLPETLRKDIQYLTEQADVLHQFFEGDLAALRSSRPSDYNSEMTEMYTTMLTDDIEWSKQILRLDLELLKEVYSYSYEFPEWERYMSEVNDLAKWMPSTELSNSCLEMLSKHEDSKNVLTNCNLRHDCLQMLDYGINFGYALSFKLLFLMLARFSRGCTVFSQVQDERIRHHLCKSAYRESEYISENDFKKVDLMAEHITFCTLDGHAQFLRKRWISSLLEHQTSKGYFAPKPLSAEINYLRITNETCLDHINAVVVGALSAATRFVLENYHRKFTVM